MLYTERTPAASPVELLLSPFLSDRDTPQALHKMAIADRRSGHVVRASYLLAHCMRLHTYLRQFNCALALRNSFVTRKGGPFAQTLLSLSLFFFSFFPREGSGTRLGSTWLAHSVTQIDQRACVIFFQTVNISLL